MTNKGYDWVCPEHNTFGDNGFSCALCGYPLGVKNLELKDGKIKILRAFINLFFFSIAIFEVQKI